MSRGGADTTEPRIIISGTGSGVGKTTVSCAVIRGFKRAGYSVRPFKAGPDYIDPGYLAAAAGREAINLDTWLMGRRGVIENLSAHSDGMAAVIEGVMGYYDGLNGKSNRASTHHIASITRTPTVLVVDAGGGGRSVAATILGFVRFNRNSMIHGVILNRIGSRRHAAMCADAIEPLGIRLLGAVPRGDAEFGSRHLGLVPPAEDPGLTGRIIAEADRVLDHLDMDGILGVAGGAGPLPLHTRARIPPAKARLGVALDGSFNFYYKNNMEKLREAGGDMVFFSPESAENMPDVHGLYVGGGFPEVRATLLEQNRHMMTQIRTAAHDGMPAYGECGGLMYLAKNLTHAGKKHRMAGVFDMDTEMTHGVTLNYTKGRMDACTISGRAATFQGHEFHYSRASNVSADSEFAQTLQMGTGICNGMDGIRAHAAMASYGHLYLSAGAAAALVANCVRYSRR